MQLWGGYGKYKLLIFFYVKYNSVTLYTTRKESLRINIWKNNAQENYFSGYFVCLTCSTKLPGC